MGFQGSLSSVNLGDIFQTVAMNRQSGTLVVTRGPDEIRRIWFDNGEIAIADGRANDGGAVIMDALVRRGHLNHRDAEQLVDRAQQTGQHLRELVAASGMVGLHDLDETALWCLEEKVCEIFEWQHGDFNFVDGPPVPELSELEIVEAGEIRLQTSQVVMEAMRRVDEWEQIRTVIPNPDELYVVDNDGRANLKSIETDAEMLKVLRYLDGRHAIDQIADAVGISRFDAFAIIANLVLNNVARPRDPEEVVGDALELRRQGEVDRARELLENAAKRINVPEVLRPLAELTLDAGDSPRAVELYLELVQRAQDDGDLEGALGDLEIVIGVNPDDPDLQLDRAEILVDLGHGDQAAGAFLAAAENFLETRDIKQAVDACHRAKDLSPTDPGPHRILAKAYLLDNQSENAVVEYKSLWHVLLTHHRPRRALEELRNILEADCKFPRIKDQILEHAGASDAVKTGSAVRRLIYLLMLLVLGGAAYYGWRFYEDDIKFKYIADKLNGIEGSLSSSTEAIDYRDLLDRLTEYGSQTRNAILVDRIASLRGKIQQSRETEATALLDSFDRHIARVGTEDRALEDARDRLQELERRFKDSPQVANILEDKRLVFRNTASLINILPKLEAVKARFVEQREWQAAIAELRAILQREEMPEELRNSWENQLAQWQANLTSPEFYCRQAEDLVLLNRSRDAMALLAKASTMEGDDWRDRARNRLVDLEQRMVEEIRRNIDIAIEKGDKAQTFTCLKELGDMAASAISEPARKALDAVMLPITVQVEHHRTTLMVTDHKGNAEQVQAPQGTVGNWAVTFTYPASAHLIIEAKRSGFNADSLEVRADDKLLQASINLKRGPLWLTRLEAVPTTDPIVYDDSQIVVCTDRNTLELLNANLGTRRKISFGEGVDSIDQPPFIYRGQAYLSISGQIHAVDIATRRMVWTWPEKADLDTSSLGSMGLWVQENELVFGQLQIITGTREDNAIRPPKAVILTVADGELTPWPSTRLNESMTAPPVVVDSILYLPIGSALEAFELTSASREDALQRTFTFKTRGEIRHRPQPATVFGQPALLLTDASGAVVAIDTDRHTAADRRSIAAWPLGGAPSGPPCLAPDLGEAYVGLDNGGVVGLNIGDKSRDRVLWRFPKDGRIGRVLGTPAIGRNGIYVADDIGHLYCIGRDGSALWQVDLGSNATTAALVFKDRIYVGTRGGDLFCFEEGDL